MNSEQFTAIQSYTSGISSLDQCRDDLETRMKTTKEKMDDIELTQKQQAISINIYLSTFQPHLRLILREFRIFKQVYHKLCQKQDDITPAEKKIIENIRQQMIRFHNLIPPHVQQEAEKRQLASRISNISQQNMDVTNEQSQQQNTQVSETRQVQLQIELRKVIAMTLMIKNEQKQYNDLRQTAQSLNKQLSIRMADETGIDEPLRVGRNYEQQSLQRQQLGRRNNKLIIISLIMAAILVGSSIFLQKDKLLKLFSTNPLASL